MTPSSPSETQAPPKDHRPFVTGSWGLEDHPAYGDEAVVAAVTEWLLQQGRTVFQTFLLDPDERRHSAMVLQRLHAPHRARVISLGCGVGGMEAYWCEERPDIEVTLVNQSMAQLARCVCPGARVLADMRDVDSLPAAEGVDGYDIAVLGYSLHHCDDVAGMVEAARSLLVPGGTLLVLDVVDGSAAYHDVVHYRTPRSFELATAGLVRLDYGMTWHCQPAEVITEAVHRLIERDSLRPSMWVGMA
jgi:SAM-dependent methyltransferase